MERSRESRRAVLPTGSRPTLATDVYARLRLDILTGVLAPGQKLRVEFVSDRYEAGASPVREALNRLSSDGLVDRHDQRGFAVAAVSLESLRELVDTRCSVEGLALQQSIGNRSDAWEDDIVLSFHRLSRTPRSMADGHYRSNPEWERAHRAFHLALIAGCGSRLLLRFCEDLRDQADRYRQIAAAIAFPKRNELAEHQQIRDQTLAGDAEAAVAALQDHYQRTRRALESYFTNAG